MFHSLLVNNKSCVNQDIEFCGYLEYSLMIVAGTIHIIPVRWPKHHINCFFIQWRYFFEPVQVKRIFNVAFVDFTQEVVVIQPNYVLNP